MTSSVEKHSFDWRRRVVLCLVAVSASSPLLMFGVTIDGSATAARAAGVTLLVALLWVFEALPLSVSALLPLILLPVCGVANANAVAKAYFNDTQMLFLASFLVAKAMQNCRLHERVALKTLLLCRSPRRTLAAFCGISFLTSMWMQNTAVASLMIPLLMTMLNRLDASRADRDVELVERRDEVDDSANATTTTTTNDVQLELESESNVDIQLNDNDDVVDDEGENRLISTNQAETADPELLSRFAEACLLGVAYSCSLGGTTTPVGTGPNLVLFAVFSQMFPSAPQVSFGSWMLFAVPLGLILTCVLWLVLAFVYLRRIGSLQLPIDGLQRSYAALGRVNQNEKRLAVIFVVQLLLWLTRGTNDKNGWGGWSALVAPSGGIRDGTIAVFIAFVIFLLPDAEVVTAGRFRRVPLLSADDIRSLPWDIILLLGGGFALADGVQTSGMINSFARWLGELLVQLPAFVLLLTLTALVTFLTEFTSNVATASIIVPIVGALAVCIDQSPLFLMVPATICCSYAFMLPSATPPNAIAFSSGKLRMRTMMSVGFFLNIVCIAATTAHMFAMSPLTFGIEIGSVPEWAGQCNRTTSTGSTMTTAATTTMMLPMTESSSASSSP
jgi:sodium-dependent dicarboxylate transporter 2/3/5